MIFTLRDSQNNVLAQAMTSNIVITDDHKTAACSRVSQFNKSNLPDGPGSMEADVCAPGLSGLTFQRNAYSTTDLQGMQQQCFKAQAESFSIPQGGSHFASAVPTPKALSRPASPPGGSEPRNKRRKAGMSGRLPPNLTMTKLPTPNDSSLQSPGVLSANLNRGLETAWYTGRAPGDSNAYFSHGLPEPPYQPNPLPTPSPSDRNLHRVDSRAHSVENVSGHMSNRSAPTSMPTSRVPSPRSVSQWNSPLSQNNAQLLANSLASLSTAGAQRQPLAIRVITPKEGSRSGGTEVTCLGTGFHEDLQVIFGDIQATRTTYWSDTALLCVSPPAQHADIVCVTLRNIRDGTIVVPPTQTATFKYINDDEQVLMRQALALVSRQYHGQNGDAAATARNLIQQFGANMSSATGSSQGNYGQSRMSGNNYSVDGEVALETAVLSCLELVDLDDSPYQANLNAQDANGQSLLHLSTSLGFYRLTAGLLARGAMPDLRDKNGLSSMHMASLRGHPQIIRKLRSAGGDPTLRTLNGYTPADMANSRAVRHVIDSLGPHSRSRSAGATPAAPMSRASSIMSTQSRNGSFAFALKANEGMDTMHQRVLQPPNSQPEPPTHVFSRSRRNSTVIEQTLQDGEPQPAIVPSQSLFATNPAMSAWIDQLSAQIQQLQQTVHRTLPSLQMPALPPIPTIPDYQAYPVVRRISSLVPQRSSRPNTTVPRPTKEGDSRWWDFITGCAASPPAYEEIYPEHEECGARTKETSLLQAKGEALIDRKCETMFDQAKDPSKTTAEAGSSSGILVENDALQHTSRVEVKKLRSDRKLFFIWVRNWPVMVLGCANMVSDTFTSPCTCSYPQGPGAAGGAWFSTGV